MTRPFALALLAGVWLATCGGIIFTQEQLAANSETVEAEARLERRLAAALRDGLPELPERGTFVTLARLLAEATKEASPERRAALWLAGDFLAVRLAPTDKPTNDEVAAVIPGKYLERSQIIAGHHVTWVWWSEPGSKWAYDHALRRTVWRALPDTTWGAEAFVLLLRSGWSPRLFCDDGPDEFHNVSREGERFLAVRPRSPVRRDVALMLAWAYETWWSLSRAKASEGDVDDSKIYAAGAADARARAITRYDEALRLGLSPAIAADARQRLAKLRRGADTEQRIFYCWND